MKIHHAISDITPMLGGPRLRVVRVEHPGGVLDPMGYVEQAELSVLVSIIGRRDPRVELVEHPDTAAVLALGKRRHAKAAA